MTDGAICIGVKPDILSLPSILPLVIVNIMGGGEDEEWAEEARCAHGFFALMIGADDGSNGLVVELLNLFGLDSI